MTAGARRMSGEVSEREDLLDGRVRVEIEGDDADGPAAGARRAGR